MYRLVSIVLLVRFLVRPGGAVAPERLPNWGCRDDRGGRRLARGASIRRRLPVSHRMAAAWAAASLCRGGGARDKEIAGVKRSFKRTRPVACAAVVLLVIVLTGCSSTSA